MRKSHCISSAPHWIPLTLLHLVPFRDDLDLGYRSLDAKGQLDLPMEWMSLVNIIGNVQ